MKLRLHRDSFSATTTLGILYIDGVQFCFTLEDADRRLEEAPEGKVYGKSAIPRGTYKVVIDYSQRFKQLMPRLIDVPGFAGIRIHPGNTHVDTDGCILVGTVRGADRILNSRVAYNRLMQLLEDAYARDEDVTIEVT